MTKEITPKQKQLILAGITLVIFLYVDLAYILKSQIKTLKSVSAKLNQVRAQVYEYKKYSLKIKDLQADLERLKKNSSKINGMVFPDADLPLLLDDISRKANALGIKIMVFSAPESPVSDKDKAAEVKPNSQFYPLAFKLELNAGFHQLGEFLAEIEDNPFMAVTEMRIVPLAANAAKEKVSLTLKAYVSKK